MNCSMCGILLEANISFCGKCGIKLPKNDGSISIKKKLYIDKNDGFKKGLLKVAKLDFIALVLFVVDSFILYEFQDLGGPISFIAIITILLVPFIFIIIFRGERLGIFIAWLVTIFFVIPCFIGIGIFADNLLRGNEVFETPLESPTAISEDSI